MVCVGQVDGWCICIVDVIDVNRWVEALLVLLVHVNVVR